MLPRPRIPTQSFLFQNFQKNGPLTVLSLERELTRQAHSSSSKIDDNLPVGSPSSASAKLFADAAREEAQEVSDAQKTSRISHLQQQHPNWDGDERIEDAVLRMLVDKYKPLRTGTIRSAEEKIRQSPPKLAPAYHAQDVNSSSSSVKLTPTTGSWATETLLPAKEGHQPWHTQFKAPSMDTASVKLANMPPPLVKGKPAPHTLDDASRRKAREEKKRALTVNKLANARESTLDYRLGVKGRDRPSVLPNPASMRGWNSLIEDKIETARKAGLFNTIKGRGKPLERSMDEYNPFIAREEFLMNRIVQRNNAAPPWVEIQRELDTAVDTFRQILREAWIRRTVRVLAMEHPSEILRRFTLEDIQRHRDSEWTAKEKSYHEVAIGKLNSLVRNYNGLAPYAVRRAYYSREAEIERLFKECPPDILRALAERDTENVGRYRENTGEGSTNSSSGGAGTNAVLNEGTGTTNFFYDWIRLFFRKLFGVGT